MIKYNDEQIEAIFIALNRLEVKGIENAKNLLLIANILKNDVKEGEDGDSSR